MRKVLFVQGAGEAGGGIRRSASSSAFAYRETRILNASDYKTVSLAGRLVIALHCLRDYRASTGLTHPALEEFEEHLWRLLLVSTPEAFQAWFDAQPESLPFVPETASGVAVLAEARERCIPPEELTALLEAVAEVVHGSFYAAADEVGSRRNLETVLRITRRRGVHPLPPSVVAESRFSDRHGWGCIPDGATVDRWRTARPVG